MSVLDTLTDGVAIAVPEIVGEFVTGLFLRGGRGRWEPIAMGDRKRAEREVRFLRRNRVSAWIRPAQGSAYEVVVRTTQADIARALLNAPGSGHPS
jgi:predicted NAD/FAD-binding protein